MKICLCPRNQCAFFFLRGIYDSSSVLLSLLLRARRDIPNSSAAIVWFPSALRSASSIRDSSASLSVGNLPGKERTPIGDGVRRVALGSREPARGRQALHESIRVRESLLYEGSRHRRSCLQAREYFRGNNNCSITCKAL